MEDTREPAGGFRIRFTRLAFPQRICPMRKVLVTGSMIAVLGLVLSARVPAPSAPAKGYGNADAITQDELKVYDYFLASDQLEGRNFPSRGYDTAALYVASHLAEWGLKPGGSPSGTTGPLQPYLMPIELVSRQIVADESKASITAPAAGGGRGGFGGGGDAQPATAAAGQQGNGRGRGRGRGGNGNNGADAEADLR